MQQFQKSRLERFNEAWIDGQDVMQTLHISKRTLQSLRDSGVLPYSRINGKFYYKVSDIEKMLEANYSTFKIQQVMEISREAILHKTHYGLNIYAYVLRQYYPGETVLSLSGRDCKPTKNPFNADKPTLIVKVVDGCATHTDTEGAIAQGNVFDFASLHFGLSGQDLNETLNEELHLRIGQKNGFYDQEESQPQVVVPEIVKPKAPSLAISPNQLPISIQQNRLIW